MRAAEQARRLYARPEAISHYWQVLDLLERLPGKADQNRVRADVILALIWLPGSMRDEEAKRRMLRHVDQALAEAETAGRAAIIARLQTAKGDLLLDEALLVDSLERAEVSGDALTQAFVARRYGNYLAAHDRFETALGHIARAIDILGAQGEWLQQAQVMAGPGRCFYARAGKLEESLAYAARVRQLGDSLGDASLRAWRAAETEPYLYKGLWDEVIRVAEESLPIAWEIREWNLVLWSSAWLAIGYLKLARTANAKQVLDRVLKEVPARALGTSAYAMPYPQIAFAQLHLAADDPGQALSAAREALSSSKLTRAPLKEGAAHRVLGQVHDTRDTPTRAIWNSHPRRSDPDTPFRGVSSTSNASSQHPWGVAFAGAGKLELALHLALRLARLGLRACDLVLRAA